MDRRRRLVFLTGAGISAESGLPTFRGMGGLWENQPVEQVASPAAWARDPALVLRFYNERRRQVLRAEPNAAHRTIQNLERDFDVWVITQNVDDLHTRAGSSRVLHLHGEIRKSRSTRDPRLIYPIEGSELELGQLCELGSQLRPHIVWFGEPVPEIPQAIQWVQSADHLIIVGTSLQVYPAAGLLEFAPDACDILAIDPAPPPQHAPRTFQHLQCIASIGLPLLASQLRGGRSESHL